MEMNFNEENPGNPCGRDGQSSSAEVLKQLMTELGALLHAHPQHGGIVINYYNSVGQRIDSVNTQNFATDKWLSQFVRDKTSRPTLPDALNTDEAKTLWNKAKEAGFVDECFQPLISRTQSAILADEMAERLGIKEKWKVFETFWNRKSMYHDYYEALNQNQTLKFRDSIRELFG